MVLEIDKKRSIGNAAKEIGVEEYVIRFWETKFGEYIKPTIGAGGRRYFFDKDIKILKFIKSYLYDKGFTIKGLQNLLKNENINLELSLTEKDKVDCINNNSSINNNNNNNNIQNINNGYDNKVVYEKDQFSFNTRESIKNLRNKLNIFYEKLKNV